MIKKQYPILPTVEEIVEYTGAELNSLEPIEQNDAINTAAAHIYGLIYGTGKKHIKKRIMEQYAEQLENAVKGAIARQVNYLLINGDIGAFNGVTRSTDGSTVNVTDTQTFDKNIICQEAITELRMSEIDILYYGGKE